MNKVESKRDSDELQSRGKSIQLKRNNLACPTEPRFLNGQVLSSVKYKWAENGIREPIRRGDH
ncbi:hypothetical protein KOR42_28980 [Thalassoglobus neptunius]|uniref:Uncharacterized protein n=1 Tax=Thalassoglobus neptunius TaxID=1938619 RepID=A0A5C5WYV5_9PLAN|nr:hypothetical protein [Thalassoglobus neptunius]TWT55271.1 hypothetical protein KOR42_28980 [Thalassoglobus neptunius]